MFFWVLLGADGQGVEGGPWHDGEEAEEEEEKGFFVHLALCPTLITGGTAGRWALEEAGVTSPGSAPLTLVPRAHPKPGERGWLSSGGLRLWLPPGDHLVSLAAPA